ncbi:hydrogenase maturation protease, partial [Arthrospira platensis SPKY2]
LVHYLRSKYAFPPHVEIVDGGTLGWQLLNLIAEYEHVVLIDAVAAPPGKVYRFGRDDVPDEIGYGKLSSHEWEVPDLLTAMDLYGDLPDVTIVAIGVDPL